MSEPWTYAIRDLIPYPDPFAPSSEPEIRVHRLAQAQLKRKYKRFQPEASLSAQWVVSGREVTVRGRVDGYRRVGNGILLYEIKPVPGDPRQWLQTEELQPARLQLQLYTDLAAQAASRPWKDGTVIGGVLLLVGDGGRTATEAVDISAASGLLEKRLRVVLARAAGRRPRPAQAFDRLKTFIARDRQQDRELQTSADGRLIELADAPRLLLSLPPGSGKTRLALRHGLLQAFERNRPLYWITTKSRGREEVLAELSRYTSAGLPLRILWKTSAERLCSCGYTETECPLKRESRTSLLFDDLSELRDRVSWSPEDLATYAAESFLCPHELTSELASEADVVIADLNYLLTPSALRRREAVLVMDEVQNLARRVLEHSQIRIRREELLALAHELPAAARRHAHELLSAEHWEQEGPDAMREEWLLFARELQAAGLSYAAYREIARAARLWEDFPGEYILRWYRGSSQPALIGSLISAEPFVERLLEEFQPILAVSGSLPADPAAREALFPRSSRFSLVEAEVAAPPPVFICPLLEFKFPLGTEDHEEASRCLLLLHAKLGPTIAVFGQNRTSNEILSLRLRVRGFTVLLDEDLNGSWDTALAARPDFLFITLGGNLAEAINPPSGLFSAAAILTPGHRAPDEFDLLRSYARSEGEVAESSASLREAVAEAVSRIIQAAGRVQRSVTDARPAFLLNCVFAEPDYLRAWPRHWYADAPHERIFPLLEDALEQLKPNET